MFCDCCGDLVVAAKPLIVVYPAKNKKTIDEMMELLQQFGFDVLPILICPQCWDKNFKGSRKKLVASMMRILKDE
jgi:hypothetical protein